MQNNDGHAAPQHSHHHIYCVIDGSYPLRPAAGKCCRSFCYACFLSGTSLLLCLTHISRFANAFEKQDDIHVITRKDYISNPKPNGYRSLHLIVDTPIFLHDRKRYMKVEVQFRTIAMDWWASTEHKTRYKKDIFESEAIKYELSDCARIAEELDQRMEQLYTITRQSKKM